MKILKIILFIIVIIVAVVLLTALFVKKEYSISKEITINKPKQAVFDYIKLLKNQDHYSKWVMQDPNIKKTFSGTDGSVGFVYAWDGNKDAGKGEQEITKITEAERIDTEVRFEKPFAGVAEIYMTTKSTTDNQTKLTWVFNGRNNYPMNFMNLFMDQFLGKDMQKSLLLLKANLEK